jgi:hypothetical protein
MSNMPHQSGRSLKRIAWDFLLYALIGIVVVICIAAFAIHEANTGGSAELPMKWLGFGALSLLAFGYPVRAFRRFWRKRAFWFVSSALAAVHLAVFVPLLMSFQKVPLIWYGLGAIVESSLISGCLFWTLRPQH